MHYLSPSPADLARLAEELGFKRAQMAKMFNVSTGRQWAKYTWTEKTPIKDRRDMGFDKLFLGASRLELMDGRAIENEEQVHARMRRIGAVIDPDADSDSQEHDGEQQP